MWRALFQSRPENKESHRHIRVLVGKRASDKIGMVSPAYALDDVELVVFNHQAYAGVVVRQQTFFNGESLWIQFVPFHDC